MFSVCNFNLTRDVIIGMQLICTHQKYQEAIAMLILSGTTVVQTYFALSGFFLTRRFVESIDGNKKVGLEQMLIAISYRFMR